METGTQPEVRVEAVYRQLDQVYDPELDQPLTELGFIGGVDINGETVTVQFRLPTYWCAANFAFMMATDIRDRISELPWVQWVEVRLQDHFLEAEINEGVNRNRSFQATFPDLASDELDELRETFRAKAFQVRQERLLRWLRGQGWDEETILRWRTEELRQLSVDAEGARLIERYLAHRQEWGCASGPGDMAFSQPDGSPLEPDQLHAYLQAAGRTRLSMEFNTMFCSGLLKTRYGESEPVGELKLYE